MANKSGRNTLEIQLQIKSIVQPDDGHYRRPKHVAASLSRLCYKYIYSCFDYLVYHIVKSSVVEQMGFA